MDGCDAAFGRVLNVDNVGFITKSSGEMASVGGLTFFSLFMRRSVCGRRDIPTMTRFPIAGVFFAPVKFRPSQHVRTAPLP